MSDLHMGIEEGIEKAKLYMWLHFVCNNIYIEREIAREREHGSLAPVKVLYERES